MQHKVISRLLQSLSKYHWNFSELEQVILKLCKHSKVFKNSQNNLDKEQSWKYAP